MFVGSVAFDVRFAASSLKDKRSVVRPVLAELVRRFPVSAAEVGFHDLHARSLLGVSVVAADAARCGEVLDGCERLIAARPELEMLGAHRRLFSDDD